MIQFFFNAALLIMCALCGTEVTNLKNNEDMNDVNEEKKVLVAFFSRADENYAVGTIEKGNTQIVAEMIAAEKKADMFHIETVKPYPAKYNECIDVAMNEKRANARPEIKGDVNIADYDIIFLGYPTGGVKCQWLFILLLKGMTGMVKLLYLSAHMRAVAFQARFSL